MKWLKAAMTAAVVGVAAAIVVNKDDIARYIKMRQM
jgi:cytosine/uracil/thiamine/allantoin permease